MRHSFSLAPSILLILLSAGAPAAMENEPSGFEKAKFGMSPAEVEKIYPGKLRTLQGLESLGAAPVGGPHVVRQALGGHRVEGLPSPTTVEFRYWKDQLWVVVVYYGANSTDAVVEALRQRLGPPSLSSAQSTLWRGDQVQVNAVHRERWYSIGYNPLSAEVQEVLTRELRGAPQPRPDPQAGTPPVAATPAP